MSLLSTLAPKEGSTHYKKRIGRGIGSGLGGTAAKGDKGQLARTGGKVRRGFEGGQTPLSRRLPKFGFTNMAFKKIYSIISLDQLDKMSGTVTPESLYKKGLVTSRAKIKILAKGKLTKALKITAHAYSESAQKAIQAAGGSIELFKAKK